MRLAVAVASVLVFVEAGFAQPPSLPPGTLPRSPSALAAHLAKQEAELARVQGEIARLRQALGVVSVPFGVRIVAFEADLDALSKAGLKFPEIPTGASETLIPWVAQVVNREDVTKVCDQRLSVMHGHRAALHIGGKYPVILAGENHEPIRDGLEIEIFATAQGEGRTSLDFRLRSAEPDPTREVTIGDQKLPGLNIRDARSGVELMPGQTGLFHGPSTQRTLVRKTGRWPFELKTETQQQMTLVIAVSLAQSPRMARVPQPMAPMIAPGTTR
jgi:hypothetical protein